MKDGDVSAAETLLMPGPPECDDRRQSSRDRSSVGSVQSRRCNRDAAAGMKMTTSRTDRRTPKEPIPADQPARRRSTNRRSGDNGGYASRPFRSIVRQAGTAFYARALRCCCWSTGRRMGPVKPRCDRPAGRPTVQRPK